MSGTNFATDCASLGGNGQRRPVFHVRTFEKKLLELKTDFSFEIVLHLMCLKQQWLLLDHTALHLRESQKPRVLSEIYLLNTLFHTHKINK